MMRKCKCGEPAVLGLTYCAKHHAEYNVRLEARHDPEYVRGGTMGFYRCRACGQIELGGSLGGLCPVRGIA